METKLCPYCGEEILTTAKKCKHCNEWLEPKDAPKHATASENTSAATPAEIAVPDESISVNHKSIIRFCWIAIVCSILSFSLLITSNEAVLDWLDSQSGIVLGIAIFFGILVQCAHILLVVSLFRVFVGLLAFCRKKNLVKTPLIALSCIITIKYIMCFFRGDSDFFFWIFFFIFLVAEFVLALISGVKFYGRPLTKKLGIGFFVYAGLPLIILMLSLFHDAENIFDSIMVGSEIGIITLMPFVLKLIKSDIQYNSKN